MKLHIFNPEHEMALAVNAEHFTLPHNIQEFRMNMGFLPALWAEDGDCVLVDDVAYAVKAAAATGLPHPDVLFLTDTELQGLAFDAVDVWGKDKAVRRRLLDAGIGEELLPDIQELNSIRGLSDRKITTDVLMSVCEGLGRDVCGRSFYVTETAAVRRLAEFYRQIVLKAPWSSSGRGVRYLDARVNPNILAWAAGIIRRQGGLMVEPMYSCVRNFAMEFSSDGQGTIDYHGLSVFYTENGNYAGNIIATEDEKMRLLGRHVPTELIDELRIRLTRFFATAFRRRYQGLFGVDMMIVSDPAGGSCRVNPCVEVNLRRTMGHVANSFKTTAADMPRVMRITHGVNYTLRLFTPDKGYVKVI